MISGNSFFTDLTFIECCHMPGTILVLGKNNEQETLDPSSQVFSNKDIPQSHLGSLSKHSLRTQPRITGLGASLQYDLASDFQKEFQ